MLDGKHDEVLVSNPIDNPIVALANPIDLVHGIDLRDAGGARTGVKCTEPFYKKLPKRFGECVELLLSRRGHKNCRDCLSQSELQFFQYDIKRLGALYVRLGQGRAGINEIDAIFQGLQEPQVTNGHHRGDRPATPAQ